MAVEQGDYKGWNDAFRLSNKYVEAVVVPSVGRVMRYGFLGGPNQLWENPLASGKPIPLNQWPNTGGDKVWPWPQSDWNAIIGRSFPPPPGADQAAHQAEVTGPYSVRLTSPLIAGWGIRIVRDIRLSPSSTNLHLTSQFVRITGGETPFPVAVWAVTQVPAVPYVYASHLFPTDLAAFSLGYKPLSGAPFASVRTSTGLLRFERPTQKAAKIGVPAARLAVFREGVLFTVEMLSEDSANVALGLYEPGEQAQIYSQSDNADDLRKGVTPYLELELTSPRKSLHKGDTLTLHTLYQMRPMRFGETPEHSLWAG